MPTYLLPTVLYAAYSSEVIVPGRYIYIDTRYRSDGEASDDVHALIAIAAAKLAEQQCGALREHAARRTVDAQLHQSTVQRAWGSVTDETSSIVVSQTQNTINTSVSQTTRGPYELTDYTDRAAHLIAHSLLATHGYWMSARIPTRRQHLFCVTLRVWARAVVRGGQRVGSHWVRR